MYRLRGSEYKGGVNMTKYSVSYFDEDGFLKHFVVKGEFHELYEYLSNRLEYLITYDVIGSNGEIFTIEL
jgi:hypothetical protein